MASKKRGPYLTPQDVATRRVIVRADGEIFTLPVNPGFQDPNALDEKRGVDPADNEATIAQAALVEAVALAMVPADGKLAPWLGRQFRRRGGASGLTDTLLALAPLPTGKDPAKYRKSLLRALERSGPAAKGERKQSHGGIRTYDYRVRIGRLALTEQRGRVILGVTGEWWGVASAIGSTFRRFNTQPEDDQDARRVLESADGAEFIALVEAVANRLTEPYEAELLRLNGLHVELRKGARETPPPAPELPGQPRFRVISERGLPRRLRR